MTENTIICGDCLEVMKEWPDKCISLCVTSPPYGELRDYKGYTYDFQAIAKQLYRVIKSGGVVVWVVKDQTINGSESCESFRQAMGFVQIGFNLHDTMIYHKAGVNYPKHTRYLCSFVYFFIFFWGPQKAINLIRDCKNKNAGDNSSGTCRQTDNSQRARAQTFERNIANVGTRQNVWTYNTGWGHSAKEKIAFEHPAIFPEQLAADHIISWSNPGDIVLDPMNGSGTTTKMANKFGRRYIGIDISPEYCEIARKRLEAVDTGVPVKEQNQGQMAMFPTETV